jgi:hypothetical protein
LSDSSEVAAVSGESWRLEDPEVFLEDPEELFLDDPEVWRSFSLFRFWGTYSSAELGSSA